MFFQRKHVLGVVSAEDRSTEESLTAVTSKKDFPSRHLRRATASEIPPNPGFDARLEISDMGLRQSLKFFASSNPQRPPSISSSVSWVMFLIVPSVFSPKIFDESALVECRTPGACWRLFECCIVDGVGRVLKGITPLAQLSISGGGRSGSGSRHPPGTAFWKEGAGEMRAKS